jgi:hypothetical protein
MEKLGSVGSYPVSSAPGTSQCAPNKSEGRVLADIVSALKKVFSSYAFRRKLIYKIA